MQYVVEVVPSQSGHGVWCVVCFGHVPSLECNNGCLCTLNDGSLLAVAHGHEELDQLVACLPHVVLQGTPTFLSANV